MTLLQIVLLTNWWVSAVLRDFSLQVHLSACLSVSLLPVCLSLFSIVVPDVQLYPDK